MRKNKFLLSLIAATAISLSVFGCGSSSDSGAVASTTDITVPNNGGTATEQQNLREYMVLGQRGLTTFTPSFAAGTSAPANAVAVIAGSGDGVVDDGRLQLYEIAGIAHKPLPNAAIVTPGSTTSTSPVVPESFSAGTSGYHSVDVDPSGSYVVGISRARDRGATADDRSEVTSTQIQVFKFEVEPLDVSFPPVFSFGPVAAAYDTIFFSPLVSEGKFVSGLWARDSSFYYASVQNQIHVFRFEPNIGRLTSGQAPVAFPAAAAGTNNAVKMLFSADGKFLYALDNGNNSIVRWDRNPETGQLTNMVSMPTVVDPRGFDIDRTGSFMYVAGRSSGLLAGYQIGTDGSLTPIEVFTGGTPVPVSLPGAPALGDVDFNPVQDQLFVATYSGVLQGYPIDPTTGALQPVPANSADDLLELSRNTTNIEVEPTGRFVFAVQENDLEELQPYVTSGPYIENPIFANIDSGTNTGSGVYSPTPMTDQNGRVVYALPATLGSEFAGDVQVFRVQADGSVENNGGRRLAENPYGISFFNKVFQPPASTSDT